MVSKAINIGLRGLEFLWTLLIMAIVGNIISNAYAGNPSVINYDMFVSVFSLLSLFYLIAGTINEKFSFHPLIMVGVDLLNSLFFFCGAIATAAALGARSCSNEGYTLRNSITNGAVNREMRCREAQAVTAFLWFGWVSYTISAVLSFFQSRRVSSGGSSRPGPSMSQV